MRAFEYGAYLWVNTIWIENTSVVLNDSDACGTSPSQVSACVQTDITETLNNECFATPARRRANGAHIISLVDEVLQTVEDTTSGSRDTTMNTALIDWFACNASMCVDVLVANGFCVGIGNPGHFTFTGSLLRIKNTTEEIRSP